MILLDTCAVIWDALEQSQLSSRARKAIERADQHNALIVSDISLWEVAMLINKGRVEIAARAADFLNLFLQSRNISVIAISPEIAAISTDLRDDIGGDPADRLIAATSIDRNAQLITADKMLRKSLMIDTLW